MKARFLFLLFISFLGACSMCSAQSYWMQQGGGQTIDEATDISIDGSGNSYATGYFTGSASFGSFNLSSSGVTDIYLAKLNPSGLYQWVVKAGGPGSDRPLSIKTDAAGNSYITGFFYGTATFGSATVTSSGVQDVFIAKYDNAGTCLWAKRAGGSLGDIGNGITVDNSGNVIVTGEFAGTATFGSTTLVSMNNSVDVFTTKLDGSGNFLWAKKGSAPQDDRGLDVAADGSGNIYVTGQFTDTITFDQTHNNNTYNAIFLIKYNTGGQEQWFRRIGAASQNIANAIAVDNNGNPVLAGDFQGTMTFFSAPGNTTLTGKYFNGIFLTKYDASGNKLWASQNSSDNPVTAKNLALDASGNAFVIGDFKCKFSDYADVYGQGTFNSVGYWDIYVSKWNAAGAWLWARQEGGHGDEYGTGITVNASGQPVFTGSFTEDIILPKQTIFLGYNQNNILSCTPFYCNDQSYGKYSYFNTQGNSDIFIAETIDSLRQPYDFYERTGNGCSRDQLGVCIGVGCPNSIQFCQGGSLTPNSKTCIFIGPDFSYTWSGGPYVTSSGVYTVTQTSADGCFVSTDSINVTVYPNPPDPTISDNVIVNTNSSSPLPIKTCKDSVLLTGGGYGSSSHTWTGPGFNGVPQTSITVTNGGSYIFTVTDSNGCSSQTNIDVKFYRPLPPFIPKLICITQPNRNDTVSICKDKCFEMLVYDSVSNPYAQVKCLPTDTPYKTITGWTVTPSISHSPECNAIHEFCPTDSGLYAINLVLIRMNICDTDTFYLNRSIYVTINPIPTASIAVTGEHWLCPGDSVMLVATGGCTNASWSGPGINGKTKDTVWIKQQGAYSIGCLITNSYGCTASANAGTTVQAKPQPTVTMVPSSGLICPHDSVMLLCSEIGTFQWQGPGGPLGGNVNSIYAGLPGNYYCIVTDTDFCVLVSNTVLLIQYSTPYLTASSNELCQGDSLSISVVAGPGSTVQWLPPLSGTGLTHFITAPGTYSCSVNSCGIVTSVSLVITLSSPLAKITPAGPLAFCAGDSVLLYANPGMASYIWKPGSIGVQNIYISKAGTYTLTTTNDLNCKATDTISVGSYPNTTVRPVTTDTLICAGESATVTASGTGKIMWYPNVTFDSLLFIGMKYATPILFSSTTYYIVSTDSVCRSEFVPLHVLTDACSDSLPNVFTPNNDGKNDVFHFSLRYSRCFEAEIFNRWGRLIYKWNDASKGWDGTIMSSGTQASDGVYYYILKYCDSSAEPQAAHGFLELHH